MLQLLKQFTVQKRPFGVSPRVFLDLFDDPCAEKKKIKEKLVHIEEKPMACMAAKKKETKVEEVRKDCKSQHQATSDKRFKPVTHVIFNLDGVVLDSEKLIQEAHAKYLLKFKKAFTPMLKIKVSGLDELAAAKVIIDELLLPIKPEVYAHGTRQFLRELLVGVKLIEGAKTLICHLNMNKIPIALTSSNIQSTFNMKMRCHQNVLKRFCHVTLRDDRLVKNGKPATDILTVAARKFPNYPQDLTKYLVIEDSAIGVETAKAAGMQSIILPNPGIPKFVAEEKADLVVYQLKDIELDEFYLPALPEGASYV